MESLSIELDEHTTTPILNRVTGSQLIQLTVGEKEFQVLLRDIQRNSLRRNIVHADFYAVPSDRVIRVRIPLEFTGMSVAVRDFGGVLIHLLGELDVECLPKDLVSEIHVDMGALNKVGDSIAIRDIALPAGIRVLMDMSESVITVTAQAAEEEVAPVAVVAPVTAEVEVIEKGKKLEEGEEEEA
jgi:large subunit ribosomal protein L25